MKWMAEETSTMQDLWRQNQSATQIGKVLGRTRDAVLGKLDRLKKAGKRFVRINNTKQQEARVAKPPPKRIRQRPPTPPPTPRPRYPRHPTMQCPCQLVELEAHNCHWPIGDPLDKQPSGEHADFLDPTRFYFCGAVTLPGEKYCPVHTRMAFRESKDEQARRNAQRNTSLAQPLLRFAINEAFATAIVLGVASPAQFVRRYVCDRSGVARLDQPPPAVPGG
ncbi:MAG TPA: GcrA family cell cycle regulator [Stellaceae bacterium]|jgi:GcrA cell cycle regulator|nr:GcrA family cell cycle regulator [Stellaceae bacterium]